MNENDLQERKAFLEEVEAPLGKSDYLTVLSLAESRLKRTPGDLDARIVICRVWIEQERFEEAEEMLREMEDILASLSQVYTRMGDIYVKKGMPESAQAFYRMFVSLNPDTPMAREISEKLKGVSQQQATDDGAIAEKEEATRVPDDFQTVTLAELYARQGHLRMAEEVLEAILNKGPYHPKAAEMLREVRERIAGQKEPEEKHAPVTPRDVGERIVIQKEPKEEYTPVTLREVHERIVGQEKPGEKHAAVTLREVHEGIATREEPVEKQAPLMLQNVGEKIAGQEEPGEKHAAELLRDVGEGIVGQEKPVEKRAAELLRELEGLRDKVVAHEEHGEKHAPVIAELSRWLNNIGRLSSHAA